MSTISQEVLPKKSIDSYTDDELFFRILTFLQNPPKNSKDQASIKKSLCYELFKQEPVSLTRIEKVLSLCDEYNSNLISYALKLDEDTAYALLGAIKMLPRVAQITILTNINVFGENILSRSIAYSNFGTASYIIELLDSIVHENPKMVKETFMQVHFQTGSITMMVIITKLHVPTINESLALISKLPCADQVKILASVAEGEAFKVCVDKYCKSKWNVINKEFLPVLRRHLAAARRALVQEQASEYQADSVKCMVGSLRPQQGQQVQLDLSRAGACNDTDKPQVSKTP